MSVKQTIRRAIPAPLWQVARRVKRGVELRRIKARGPITKQALVDDFATLGLEKDDVLVVYSSLRSIGFVEGGPDTVIDALMEVVGPGGTLAFPTFTIAGTMSETLAGGNFVFDPATSPSTVGRITEVFRHRPGVHRSLHPTHSVAAWGRLAREITATHLEDGTNFGASSPFGKLLQFDAKAVGLGVTFAPITFYHAYEDMNLDKFPGVYLAQPFKARIRTPEGDRGVDSLPRPRIPPPENRQEPGDRGLLVRVLSIGGCRPHRTRGRFAIVVDQGPRCVRLPGENVRARRDHLPRARSPETKGRLMTIEH